MQDATQFNHRFDFLFGEAYEHLVIPSGELENAPNCPGLYSWHIRLPTQNPERATEFLKELFHDASLSIEARANMRQTWSGRIRSDANAFEEGISIALPLAFVAIAYPLYIGISRDLRGRLLTHRKQLDIYKSEKVVEDSVRGEDDEAESRYFGQRLGAVFSRAQFFGTDRLFVKCVPWPTRSSEDPRGPADLAQVMSELRATEWTCNTLFHPVFGRQ